MAAPSIVIREAAPADAEAAAAVLRRSITECCAEDHHNDPAVLAAWLRNKTPENTRRWFSAPGDYGVVAAIDGRLAGVGMLSAAGRITLCYLLPEARFRGAGRSMLLALEAEARRRGLTRLELTSTRTAHAFYARNGYTDTGQTEAAFGMTSPILAKAIG